MWRVNFECKLEYFSSFWPWCTRIPESLRCWPLKSDHSITLGIGNIFDYCDVIEANANDFDGVNTKIVSKLSRFRSEIRVIWVNIFITYKNNNRPAILFTGQVHEWWLAILSKLIKILNTLVGNVCIFYKYGNWRSNYSLPSANWRSIQLEIENNLTQN